MKRNLKALGLALVAAFAMSAVAATAAQANFTQPEDKYPVAITGEEEGDETKNYFEITPAGNPARVHCEDVTYEGTLAEESTTLTVTPHYTNCEATAAANINAEVDLNGCHYTFHIDEKSTGAGSVSIDCPGEIKGIEVTTSLCDTFVPEQEVGGITYKNDGDDVTVEARINDLTYEETKTSIFGPCEQGFEGHDGIFVSDVRVTGYEDLGTHHWLTEDPSGLETTKETLTEGEPLKIDVG